MEFRKGILLFRLSRLSRFIILPALLILPCTRSQTANVNGGTNIQWQPNHGEEQIVEIALVCDKEFGDIFNNDRKKIIEYLTALFWDVSLRFKTLASSNISFRVTSLTTIRSTGEQPFIETSREHDGKVDLHKALYAFSKWMYTKIGGLPKFDLAMLIVSSRNGDILGLARINRICELDLGRKRQQIGSSTVVTVRTNWNPASVIAHEIAHVLGANHDENETLCTPSRFIMGKSSYLKGHQAFFFSSCTDQTIAKVITSAKGECLRQHDESITPIIDTSISSGFTGKVSIDEQCRVLREGYVGSVKQTCNVGTQCVPWWPLSREKTLYLQPLEGTPCGESRRCFRGTCLLIGFQLANVVTGQCLTSRNNAVLDDMPKMSDCLKFPTPLDLLIVRDMGSLGKLFITPYSSPEGDENGEKCLTLEFNEEILVLNLTFAECSNGNNNESFGWQLTELENGGFQLAHSLLNKVCLGLSGNSSQVVASINCSENDNSTRWRLLAENGTVISNPVATLREYADDDREVKLKRERKEEINDFVQSADWMLPVAFVVVIGIVIAGSVFYDRYLLKVRGPGSGSTIRLRLTNAATDNTAAYESVVVLNKT